MKKPLDLTNWLDRRELKARCVTTLLRYGEGQTIHLRWLLAGVTNEPNNQKLWDDLAEEHKRMTT